LPAVLLLLIGWTLVWPAPASSQDSVVAAVQQVIEAGRLPRARWPVFARHSDAVARLYAARGGEPVWFVGPVLSREGLGVAAALLRTSEHGLDPRDYDAADLDEAARRSLRTPLSVIDRARLDVSLTVNLMRFLDDLETGRLHPGTLDRASDVRIDLAAAISAVLAGDSVPRLAAAVAPQLAQYRNLQRHLVRYRRLTADSWVALPSVPAPIQRGDPYPGSWALRRRLAALGDLTADSLAPSGTYDRADEEAVTKFQVRHGLEPTGALDSATFAEINVPFARRVRQLELALERLRWLPPIGRQRFVVVNIPAFRLFAFDSAGGLGVPALSMRVIVGKALDKQTPVLYEQMRYIELRPYWNVPRSILTEEIIPILRRDSAYLSRNDMELVGAGDLTADASVSVSVLERLAAGELRVRQRPGPANALGLLKFVFPNSAGVYMHGTPQPELFAHTRRDFSHGCIRVEDPTALAAWVLRDRPEWPRERIEAAQTGPTTLRAMLTRPMPVVVFYTTAVASPDGVVWFYSDIYGHDRTLDEALRGGPASLQTHEGTFMRTSEGIRHQRCMVISSARPRLSEVNHDCIDWPFPMEGFPAGLPIEPPGY
jgi:murein L,D-transpeptidase YcbB/YkuD